MSLLVKPTRIINNNQVNGITPTYVDLHLDISGLTYSDNVLANDNSVQGRDIVVDYNELAIRNSIVNILMSSAGEYVLVPEFGSNLRRHLFEPVNESRGYHLGKQLVNVIEKYEPRIVLQTPGVIVQADLDLQQYDLLIIFKIINFEDKDFNISLSFGKNSGIVLHNNR